jgi:hypothetical protein
MTSTLDALQAEFDFAFATHLSLPVGQITLADREHLAKIRNRVEAVTGCQAVPSLWALRLVSPLFR